MTLKYKMQLSESSWDKILHSKSRTQRFGKEFFFLAVCLSKQYTLVPEVVFATSLKRLPKKVNNSFGTTPYTASTGMNLHSTTDRQPCEPFSFFIVWRREGGGMGCGGVSGVWTEDRLRFRPSASHEARPTQTHLQSLVGPGVWFVS